MANTYIIIIYARNSSKHSTRINFFNSYMNYMLSLSPFQAEGLNNLLKVTQLVIGRAEIWMQASGF